MNFLVFQDNSNIFLTFTTWATMWISTSFPHNVGCVNSNDASWNYKPIIIAKCRLRWHYKTGEDDEGPIAKRNSSFLALNPCYQSSWSKGLEWRLMCSILSWASSPSEIHIIEFCAYYSPPWPWYWSKTVITYNINMTNYFDNWEMKHHCHEKWH